ncbi:hypothetical protein [Paraburkholderia sp. RL17-373-BIF-A]|uniref:hypothetical protein n=1 Tax=Paraburkholderia sp. RL17-373-BIF-A TaxID=3031629 RepID=UPI0038B9B559
MRTGSKQQFVSIERAVAIEDRLAAQIDELRGGQRFSAFGGCVEHLDVPGSGLGLMVFRHGASGQVFGKLRSSDVSAGTAQQRYVLLTDIE